MAITCLLLTVDFCGRVDRLFGLMFGLVRLGLFWCYVVCDLFLLLGSVCCCSLMGWVLVAGVICYLLVLGCVLLCLWVMFWDSWIVLCLVT